MAVFILKNIFENKLLHSNIVCLIYIVVLIIDQIPFFLISEKEDEVVLHMCLNV